MAEYLVLIPAFNEEKRVSSVIQGVKKFFPQADVLVVDDGSSDETRGCAIDAGAKVISHPFNLGYGTALQTGYIYALKREYATLVQMDGDGQHDPSSIVELLTGIQSGEADIVIGSRFLKTLHFAPGFRGYPTPFVRKLGMKLFSMITSAITRQKITDSTSGYQAMNRRVLEWVSSDKFPWDYPDADVIIMLHRAGFRIMEVPVRMVPRETKKSMHSGWKPLYYVFKMFLSILLALMRK